MEVGVALVHLADAGRAATRRAGPLLAGVGTVSAIIFSRQGMSAADALAAMAALPALRGGMFAAWVLASAPAARVLFGTPSTLWLRSLAGPWSFYPTIAAALLVLETPWVLLHARGGGLVAGVAALGTAAGAHAMLAARGFGLVGFAALTGAVVAAPGWGWLAAAGAASVVAGVPAAFRAAAVSPARARAVVAGPTVVALALAYLVSAWRGARPAWTRGAIVLGAGAAATALVARNHALEGGPLLRLALGMGAPILAVALGGIIQAIIAVEPAARWLLDATGVPAATRTLARQAALAATGGFAGTLLGTISAGPPGAAAGAPWGAALAIAVGAAVRRAGTRDDVAFILAAAVAVAFAIIAGLA